MTTADDTPPEFAADALAAEPELAASLGRLTELFEPASIPAGPVFSAPWCAATAPL